MKSILVLVIAVTSIISVIGCRSTKTLHKTMVKKDTVAIANLPDSRADSVAFMGQIYKAVQANHITFNTFSGKMKVNFDDNRGKKNDFNAFIRIKKDSMIWVSINAALGIEAFRILITPDSVKVLNKLDKEAQLRSVSYLQEVTKIPFNFYQLQDLLIGNPVFLDSTFDSYQQDVNSISLISTGKVFKNLLTVTTKDTLIQSSKLDDVVPGRSRTAYITYGGFTPRDGITFATDRVITASEKSKIEIRMEYKQFAFNEQLNFPFSIPKNYKTK
ncbi:MAG TPA: DUF4292 domain-containing protein [Flavitalea sp.]|nr:DUF4292 domain-containing protein [Flavitalea sp.]